MRPAPAVSVQGAGGRLWWWALCLLPGCAAAAVGAWWAGWQGWAGLWQLVAAGAGGVLGAAWPLARGAPPAARLQWDEQAWSLDGAPGEVAVMLDLDRWLLLRWRAAGAARRWWQAPRRTRWLALAAREAPDRWHALRVALFAAPASAAPAPSRLARGAVE